MIANGKLVVTSTNKIPTSKLSIENFDPYLYIDMDRELATFNHANNAALGTVTDWSKNGFVFTQATAGNRALFKTNIINGKPVLRWDGVNDLYTTVMLNIFTSIAGCSLIVVYKRVGGSAVTQVLSAASYAGAGGAKGVFFTPSTSASVISCGARRSSGGAIVNANTTNKYDLNAHVAFVNYVAATGLCELWIDGILQASNVTTDLGATTDSVLPVIFTLGSSYNVAGGVPTAYYNGDIAKYAVFKRSFSDSEIISLSKQLMLEYAIV